MIARAVWAGSGHSLRAGKLSKPHQKADFQQGRALLRKSALPFWSKQIDYIDTLLRNTHIGGTTGSVAVHNLTSLLWASVVSISTDTIELHLAKPELVRKSGFRLQR
jgi:hypothetical protein